MKPHPRILFWIEVFQWMGKIIKKLFKTKKDASNNMSSNKRKKSVTIFL